MAEFQEVMKQAKRMCRQIADCNGCPLDLPEGCKMQPYSLPDKWDVEELEKAADIVMDWAAKNPEPRYPTWKEWLRMLGAERLSDIIPADIAEKLGIKPMGEDEG